MTLNFGKYYHIFNRGNNREMLFREEKNYHYFLDRYVKYLYPIVDTYAYCLLPNHFHFLVRIKDLQGVRNGKNQSLKTPSKHFSNLFNAYTKAINKTYQRTGSLFEKPFHRKEVKQHNHLKQLVLYIHFNPQKHGIISDYRLWPFSTYEEILHEQPTRIQRLDVLNWFGGQNG